MNDPDLQGNIRRTVGFSALRRLSGLARQENERAAADALLARRIGWLLVWAALAGLVWLSARIFA